MFAIETDLETGSFSADDPREEEPGFGSTVEVSSIGEPLAITHSKNGKQRDLSIRLHFLFQEDQASLPFLGVSTLKKALGQRVFRNLPEICTPQKCSVQLRLEVGHDYVRKSTGSAC